MLYVTVNGAQHPCRTGTLTVADLVAELSLAGKRVAVERNGEIVPKSLHPQVPLADGDRLEIVVAVGGG